MYFNLEPFSISSDGFVHRLPAADLLPRRLDISLLPPLGFLPQRHSVLFLRTGPELPQAQRGKNGGQYI